MRLRIVCFMELNLLRSRFIIHVSLNLRLD